MYEITCLSKSNKNKLAFKFDDMHKLVSQFLFLYSNGNKNIEIKDTKTNKYMHLVFADDEEMVK